MAINFDHQRDRISTNSEILTVNTNGALRIPVGTNGQRPTSGLGGGLATGQIRFNTELQAFEGYNGIAWSTLGGVIDVDQNTYIIAETSPGANNNDLDFYTDGVQRLQIDENGNFLFGDGLDKFIIHWATGQTTITSANILDLTSGRVVLAGADGELEDSANLTFDGTTLLVTGDLDVTGNVTIGGNITIGDTDTDSITLNADITSNIIPNANDTYDLGATTKAWRDLYLTESIAFEGATGDHEIVLTTNLADALSVRDSAGDLMVFSTTSGSNSVSITPPTVLSTSLQIAGTTTINQILDEDNMASNSNSALATQQSIKAYVDAQVTAPDLDIAGDTGTGSVDLDSQTFTVAGTANEIETTVSGQTVTVGLPADVTIANNLTVTNQATVNGSAVLTTANEGSGNGLDADTVDGNHYADIIAEATALAIALG